MSGLSMDSRSLGLRRRVNPLKLILLIAFVAILPSCLCRTGGETVFGTSEGLGFMECGNTKLVSPQSTLGFSSETFSWVLGGFQFGLAPKFYLTLQIDGGSEVKYETVADATSLTADGGDSNLGKTETIHASWQYIIKTGEVVCSGSVDLERPDLSTSTPTSTPTAIPTATNTPIPPPANPSIKCDNLRLTSPLGGLLNGVNTFYWDPIKNATSYRINIYSGGSRIASWNAGGDATNLQGDAGSNAIGGANPFTVELVAFDANGKSCKVSATQDREWLPPPPPPAPEQPQDNATPEVTPPVGP